MWPHYGAAGVGGGTPRPESHSRNRGAGLGHQRRSRLKATRGIHRRRKSWSIQPSSSGSGLLPRSRAFTSMLVAIIASLVQRASIAERSHPIRYSAQRSKAAVCRGGQGPVLNALRGAEPGKGRGLSPRGRPTWLILAGFDGLRRSRGRCESQYLRRKHAEPLSRQGPLSEVSAAKRGQGSGFSPRKKVKGLWNAKA